MALLHCDGRFAEILARGRQMMQTLCLGLKLALMLLLLAFALRAIRDSGSVRAIVVFASPFALFVVYAVPSSALNMPIAVALTASALMFSTKQGA